MPSPVKNDASHENTPSQRSARISAEVLRRLADEYDAAQERGEVATRDHGGANIANGVPKRNTVATVTDLGLTRQQVHEARQIRNAEAVAPGAIRRALDERLAQGQEPTKVAAVLAHQWSAEELAVEDATQARRRNAVRTAILLATV